MSVSNSICGQFFPNRTTLSSMRFGRPALRPGKLRMARPVTEKHFIIATAGHGDHGKSALVKALTGIDPDRLPEEKARQITIELGFAQLILDGPNEQRFHIGIV